MDNIIPLEVTPFDAMLTFRLQRKADTFGPVPVDHWWMALPTVYPTARDQPANYRSVVDAFWQLCRQAGGDRDRDVAESYLLARLLPHVRPHGSRTVVADARLHRTRPEMTTDVTVLDALLRSDPLDPISEVEFRDRTGDALGPVDMTADDVERYTRFCDDLLARPRELLLASTEAAADELRQVWTGWVTGFGRRAGRDADKRVLDVLSYEARAALHRCYSAVWAGVLLPHLSARYALSAESARFLAFWHLEQSREPAEPDAPAYFHLFHGHAFGLHPAGSDFVQTSTGKSLLGTWLQAGAAPHGDAYGRLLRGLLVAVHHYAGRRDSANADRRGRPGRRPKPPTRRDD